MHERTIDWVTAQFGQLQTPTPKESGFENRKTPSGNAYLLWTSKDGNFVSSPSRTFTGTFDPAIKNKPIPDWDAERYVSILSHFIRVGAEPICDVGIDFSEPKTVERRDRLASIDTGPVDDGDHDALVEEAAAEEELGEPMHGPHDDNLLAPILANSSDGELGE